MFVNSVRNEFDSALRFRRCHGRLDAGLAPRWHEPSSIEPLRLVSVVGVASQLDVLDRRFPAHAMGPHMVELEEPSLMATMAPSAHERAPRAVAKPDRTLDVRRDMPCPRRRVPHRAWPRRGGELLPGQVLEQGCEGPIDDLARIAIGDRVAQE